MVLNVDDYHNIHTKRRPDNAATSDVHHFRTILLKGAPEIPAVPFTNSYTGKDIINPNGIDSNIIIENVQHSIFPHLWLTYNERKLAFARELPEASNHEERMEMLLIHSYDNRIIQRRVDRSMNNTKLINLVEGSLRSTEDYINALKNVLDVPELKSYLEQHILAAPMDYPGQFYVRCAISSCLNSGNRFELSPLLPHIVPMIGPLHVSLNSRETVFMFNYAFFNQLYCEVYMKKRPLAKKPRPYRINLLLELAVSGWNMIRTDVINKFRSCKDIEVRYLLDLLDNITPLVLDFYPLIFRSGHWPAYMDALFRAWTLFFRYGRKHYNKLPLAFFSDVFYWFNTQHPMAQVIEQNLHLFNDYYVENFHSSLRLQTNEFNSPDQIIQQAKNIDQARGNNTFKETFSEPHNIIYTERELEFMKKRTAAFLLKLFIRVHNNLGKTVIDTSGRYKQPKYKLPSLETVVDVKVLPLAWNTNFPPKVDKYCDQEGCESSYAFGCNLACGHSYHYECFFINLSGQCHYCHDYLIEGIVNNSRIFQNSISCSRELVLEEDDTEVNVDEGDDNETFTLDTSIDLTLNNLLSSFNVL